ncbi:protein pxr1-like [Limosa lapponica baueri]|uniref:Protein pxr1-like n=1 Tax=Limosa lapponica baueri TaxID=1758121 RepID=A0A2I0U2V5_LIMLA|nr:protein pxr1-like [Limosa lapponica baueri]
MLASSKMDPPLAKAKPISDGSTSVIKYLRRGKNCCATATAEGEIHEKNRSADSKVSEEGGEGSALCTGTEIPLPPMVKTMVRQAVVLQPMEVNSRVNFHLQLTGDPTPEQMDAPKGGCEPVGSLC